jgi:hypothetical protein
MEDRDKTILEGPICDYLKISGAYREDSRDTWNSARKKTKDTVRSIKGLGWALCVKVGSL